MKNALIRLTVNTLLTVVSSIVIGAAVFALVLVSLTTGDFATSLPLAEALPYATLAGTAMTLTAGVILIALSLV